MSRWRGNAALFLMCSTIASVGTLEHARGGEVVISINKATQTMSVLVDGAERHNWVVSTGIGGGPPNGTYRAGRMERKWASRKYNMAPMPYSIFFDSNYAIHGTVKIAQLGRRASKGCVRLHPRDAAVLFDLVGRNKANTTIVVASAAHVMPKLSEPPVIEVVRDDAVAVPVSGEAKLEIENAAPQPVVAAPEVLATDE